MASVTTQDSGTSALAEPRSARERRDSLSGLTSAGSPASTSAPSPGWWERLFPGRADGRPASPWHLAILLTLPAVLLYPCLSFYLFEPDEGRYAEIPREMLAAGEWIVPTLQGEPYLDKPPLFYWCVMLSFAVCGCHDWSARIVSALATHGAILVSYFLGRRLLGPRPAFWGSLLLTLGPGFIGMSRLLLLDGLLTFFVTLSLLAAYLALTGERLHRGWWYLAALACGLGMLTKGPVALILLAPPLWLARRLERRGWALPWRHVFGFALVVIGVNLPWYVAITLREPEFAEYFFVQHNVQRFVDPFDHERPFWFFLPLMFLGLLPGTLLLPGAAQFLWSRRDLAAQARPPALGYLLLAGSWCVLFFSLSGCKLPTYVLPAFAPLALALGAVVASSRWERSRWALGVAGIWSVLLVATHWFVVPAAAAIRSPMGRPDQVRQWCGDPAIPIYGFPRPVDSVAFYLGRADLVNYRSKDMHLLIERLEETPRAVVLFGHRHSIDLLRMHLPPHLKMTEAAPLGLCDMAKIERAGEARR